ncbi:DnaB domain protein helicase domain protein [Xylanimonas cellulosilytica DSM 15894]|uniref:DnaB domain protein helicase domain protein n=1 Tax=Xylanimonas cellulosilytica (strain DSM 15894 / JCM 12276 / CECT 5975 / KCTC 9989 / LMG 20990 / NBRC 107835 / XIL07) TaxID=446471 RepID=D1BWN4_XYLCX|nr:DnaB domain protein helicase domain protein [Xylanimonas cellulosilytica DSM 15894]
MSAASVTAAFAAERAVVGAALLDPESIRQSAEHVSGDDFHDLRLGAVFAVACEMHARRDAVDAITVDAECRSRGIRGVAAADLFALIEATPTTANAGHYAKEIAEAATRRRLTATGIRMRQLGESDAPLSEVMTAARGEWEAIAHRGAGRLATRTLAQVLDGSDEYDWLIPNLLERMDRLILTGGEGAGKSTFVRQLAVCAAAGVHPTTFKPIAPVKVVVVDAENTERQWRRAVRGVVAKARQVGSADPAEAIDMLTVDGMPTGRLDVTTDRDLGAIHRLIDEHEPDLLLIGPLYKLVPRAINNDDDAAPLINALDSLRARGVALVMEAHAGHATNATGVRDLRPRGSAALMGWPEFGLGLTIDRDEQAKLGEQADPKYFTLVRWRGDRDERAWPKSLERGGHWPWTPMDPELARWSGPGW